MLRRSPTMHVSSTTAATLTVRHKSGHLAMKRGSAFLPRSSSKQTQSWHLTTSWTHWTTARRSAFVAAATAVVTLASGQRSNPNLSPSQSSRGSQKHRLKSQRCGHVLTSLQWRYHTITFVLCVETVAIFSAAITESAQRCTTWHALGGNWYPQKSGHVHDTSARSVASEPLHSAAPAQPRTAASIGRRSWHRSEASCCALSCVSRAPTSQLLPTVLSPTAKPTQQGSRNLLCLSPLLLLLYRLCLSFQLSPSLLLPPPTPCSPYPPQYRHHPTDLNHCFSTCKIWPCHEMYDYPLYIVYLLYHIIIIHITISHQVYVASIIDNNYNYAGIFL